MCGICGVLAFDGAADEPGLRRMAARLVHRGPDEEGFFLDGPIGLGVRRLRVIDPEGGAQPRVGGGPSAIVLNGEIYDFEAIRRRVEPRSPEPFRGRGDAEVALRSFQALGPDGALGEIDGMFALAFWDGAAKTLVLARDRVGVKPLYWHVDSERLLFASEIDALLAYEPGRAWRTDLVSLDQYLALEYVPAPRTLVEGVRKLLPGHSLRAGAERGAIEMRPYWQLEPAPGVPEAEAPALLREALERAVASQLVADVPLGVLLSGGLDSSVVAALAAKSRGSGLKTFSIAFDDASYDESPHALRVARAIGSDHRVTRATADAARLLPEIVPRLDDLIADTSVFPTFLLARAAREEVTVALSGDGGDELFGGYDTYAAERLARRYARLPARLRAAIASGVLSAVSPSGEKKKGLRNRLRRFVEGERLPSDLAHYRWMVSLDSAARADLHGPRLAEATRDRDPYAPVRWAFSRAIATDPDARGMEVDLRLYLPDDILTKVDRMSMAHSLEVRVPILDHRVVELAQRLPVALRGGAGRRKEVLRRAARGLVPDETLRRGKEGFSAPVKRWLRGPLRSLLRERLLDGGDEGLFRRSALEKMLAEHDSLARDHAHRLFPIFLFLLWRDCHIPRGTTAAERI